MKRLILFLLLLAAPLYAAEPFEIARTNPYVAGGNYAAACTYPAKDAGTGTGSYVAVCSDGPRTGLAFRFTAGSTYTPRRIIAALRLQANDLNKTMTAYIYNDGEGVPGSAIVTSNSKNTSVLTTSYADINFDVELVNSSELASGTPYWVVVMTNTSCTFGNAVYQDGAAGVFADKYAIYNAGWTGLNSAKTNYSTASCN